MQNLLSEFLYGTKNVNVQERKVYLMSGKTGPLKKQGVAFTTVLPGVILFIFFMKKE